MTVVIPAGVANEFAKMRRLRVLPVVLVMVAGVGVLSCSALTAPDFFDVVGDPAGQPWQRLLVGMGFAVPLVSPILIAVLASRQVDMEHHGNGWLLSHTAGLSPGRLCRSKVTAVGAVLVAATVLQSLSVAGLGVVTGITVAFPASQWVGYTASVVVVNLVLLVAHVLLAGWVENQLVGLGVGVVGVFLAAVASGMPAWMAHLTPWGYYTLATPVDYVDEELVAVTPSYPSVTVLGLVGVAVLLVLSRRLDRREV